MFCICLASIISSKSWRPNVPFNQLHNSVLSLVDFHSQHDDVIVIHDDQQGAPTHYLKKSWGEGDIFGQAKVAWPKAALEWDRAQWRSSAQYYAHQSPWMPDISASSAVLAQETTQTRHWSYCALWSLLAEFQRAGNPSPSHFGFPCGTLTRS